MNPITYEDNDTVSELKDFDFNDRWNLFPCSCGFKTNKSRKAMKHIKDVHNLELADEDIHIKVKGRFTCDCGNEFSSYQVSIIYQNQMISRLPMRCVRCKATILPTIVCTRRKLSDNALSIVCRWKSTMRKIPKRHNGGKFFNKGLDHLKDYCIACQMGVCETRSLIKVDDKFKRVKIFNNKKHQILSRNRCYDVISLEQSILSGATSIL